MTDEQKLASTRIWEICKDVASNVYVSTPSPDYAHSVACLLLGTAAQESNFKYRRQLGFSSDSDGGAFSLWQMERAAIENGLKQLKGSVELSGKVSGMVEWDPSVDFQKVKQAVQQPQGDLFACILARLYYLRCPGAIPDIVYGQAAYWKRFWNTNLGAGTQTQYLNNWERLCKEIVEADTP